ncbi:MAG: hypothetical protein GVX96_05470 [Bacteroidetes bacterium]|jgi:hypothetical protein|nr:hypothetical protein [Bacteroidota bacterium]
MRKIFYFLAMSLLVLSCADNGEGELVTEVDFPEGQYPDYSFSFEEETELCDKLDRKVLQNFFPDANEFKSTSLTLSRYGMNNGGCRLSWVPSESIGRTKVGDYFHASSEGSIEIKFNKNTKPESMERFAQRSMTQKVKPPEDSEFVNELDFDYYRVNGVGSYAVWNNGSSTLEFAVGDNHIFSLSVKYPLPAEERREIAKALAQAFIAQTQ